MRVNYKTRNFSGINLSNPLTNVIKLSLIAKVLMRENNLRSKHYFDFFRTSPKHSFALR